MRGVVFQGWKCKYEDGIAIKGDGRRFPLSAADVKYLQNLYTSTWRSYNHIDRKEEVGRSRRSRREQQLPRSIGF
ncbi:hypothetical protein VNO80_00341 [Phaseolus coccineus]|uniref:Uncharacterized protein n=1 Tax=Phaseolus coccineus TaxID=3886 RepID=A0AAN9NYL6_PHACN